MTATQLWSLGTTWARCSQVTRSSGQVRSRGEESPDKTINDLLSLSLPIKLSICSPDTITNCLSLSLSLSLSPDTDTRDQMGRGLRDRGVGTHGRGAAPALRSTGRCRPPRCVRACCVHKTFPVFKFNLLLPVIWKTTRE
eukprot:COSAG06_NODE_679_length_13142_cov_15.143832_9_plen_140_part_00